MANKQTTIWLAHFICHAMEARDTRAGERSHDHLEREIEAGTREQAEAMASAMADEAGEGWVLDYVEETYDL